MPCLIYELDETYATITRPIAIHIAKQLIRNLAITNDIPICFPGANGKVTTWNSTTEESQDSANFNNREKVWMTIREEYIEDDLLTMYNQKHFNPIIFNDKPCRIEVFPVYSRTKVTINFTYRSQDRYQAESFRDNWRRHIAMDRQHMVFSGEYKYPIPEVIMNCVQLLFNKRKTYRKEYSNYKDYFLKIGTDRLTVMTNRNGKHDVFAMEEVQQNIIGNFNDAVPPEAEKDDIGAVWTVQFDYEFHYDKPISVGIRYPLLIDNQLVDDVLFPPDYLDLYKIREAYQSTLRYNFDHIQNQMGYLQHVQGAYIRIPEFDDWSNGLRWNKFRPLVTAMLIVDRETPRAICNLVELGDYGINEALIEPFKQNCQWLTRPNEFPFFISLYKGRSQLRPEDIYVNYELDVTSTHDMSIFEEYHLVIHLLRDINQLTPRAQKEFFKYPALVNAWLDIMIGHPPILINPSMLPAYQKEYKEHIQRYGRNNRQHPFYAYPKVLPNGYVDPKSFREICNQNHLHYADNKPPYVTEGPGCLLSTVGVFTVNTQRQLAPK